MPIRRRAWLTREGWYYLAVLAFILGGAVLRSINLLVILAGTMIGPLLFNWRLVMASLMGLVVRRTLPSQIIAGEPLTVEIRVQNTRWWMSSWLLRIEDQIHREESKLQGPASEKGKTDPLVHAQTLLAHVPAGREAVGTYRLTLHRRGRYVFGPLRVSTQFPLGLVRGHITLPQRAELIVSPRLGTMLPPWANLLEAQQLGDERRHPQRGMSEGDYYGLRPWQSGDSLRWVHWRTTAKLGRPIVRQYERRRSRDVAIVLDPWLPKSANDDDRGRAELAISFAATALYDISTRAHARLTLGIASDSSRCLAGPASVPFCEELLAELAELSLCKACRVSDAIAQALESSPQGTRMMVVSSRPAGDPSLEDSSIELPIDPEDVAWIDTGSDAFGELFTLQT